MLVTRLTIADRDTVFEIQQQMLPHMGWSREGMERMLALDTSWAFGGRDEKGKLLGFILIQVVVDEAEILSIAVRQEGRRQGVGSELWHTAMAHMKNAGVRHVFLEVAPHNNPAVSFYTHHGFMIKGQRQGYYTQENGKKIPALTMYKIL